MAGISWGDTKRRPRPAIGGGFVVLALALLAPSVPGAVASASGPEVAVIVRRAAGADTGAAERAVAAVRGDVGRQLAIIDSVSARVPQSELGRLRAMPDIASVLPDAPVQMLSTEYTPTTDFGSVYNAQLRSGVHDLHKAGLTGAGVTVALIDTGIVPVNGLRTPGKVIYGPDLSFESQAENLRNLDTYGHGTHMAGIIAGRDDAAYAPYTDPSHFTGVAPEARILSLKIGDARGATDVSTMIAAIDWVVAHKNDNGMNVRVMNLSFGTDSTQSYLYDPLVHAVENAWDKGIAVVAAAGNSGNNSTRLDNPARTPLVIAVGSVSYASDTTNGKQLQVQGQCLTTLNGATAERTPVVIAPCNGLQNQRWNFKTDGSVRHVTSGRCLDVYGQLTADGTKVIIFNCNGQSNQKWTGSFAKTSQLISAASGKCLDDPFGSTTAGTQLIIWPCNPGYSKTQRFIFPLTDDALSTFSQGGDGSRNPDVLAPGQSIAGLRAPGSFVDRTYTTGLAGDRFFRGSGTSQAAAFVSGVVALQYQRRPNAKPDDVKDELRRLGLRLTNIPVRLQGEGTLDIGKLTAFGTAAAPAQGHRRSYGYGYANALQASRGSMSLSMDNVVLTGEKDIFGMPFNAQAMAAARATGSSWSGGTWNGSAWAGSSWSGSSWSGSSWSGSSWSGSRWTTQTYSSNVWDGSRWTGSSWSGSTWSGSSWSGSAWSSNTIWGQ